jgi:hypothetical protein
MISAVIGVVLCLVGALWIGQGVGSVHGSPMTGHAQWSYIGGILVVVGVGLLVWVGRQILRR